MIDIRLIREEREQIEAKLKTKDPQIDLSRIVDLDHQIRSLKTKAETLKSERNRISKEIGELKRAGKETDHLMQTVSGLGEEIQTVDHTLAPLEEALIQELARLPIS